MYFLQKHFQKILFLVSLAVLSPYIYISCFAQPIADDYHYSFLGMQNDFWNEWKWQYLGRNGRYASNILVLLNPMAFHNLFLYKVMPVIQIVFTGISIYYFFRAISSRSFSRMITLNASILFLLLYLFCIPCLAEGIYWHTGAVSYQSGICFLLLYLGSIVDYFNGKYFINKYLHPLICICLLLASTGFNEVLTLLIVSMHFIISGFLLIKKKKASPEWWVFFLISLTGACIMIFSPGNSVRSACYMEHYDLIRSLSFTGMQIDRFACDWISSLPFIFSTLLLAIVSIQYKEKFLPLWKLGVLNPILLVIFLLWILFLCIFPAYWETNILGQQRTVNTAHFFFLLLWFISIPGYANRLSEKIIIPHSINFKVQVIALLLVFITMASTKNGYDIFLDLLYGKAEGYNYEMNERYKTLMNPDNKGKTVYLKALHNKPKSIFVLDLSAEPDNWTNADPATYFGVEKIICRP